MLSHGKITINMINIISKSLWHKQKKKKKKTLQNNPVWCFCSMKLRFYVFRLHISIEYIYLPFVCAQRVDCGRQTLVQCLKSHIQLLWLTEWLACVCVCVGVSHVCCCCCFFLPFVLKWFLLFVIDQRCKLKFNSIWMADKPFGVR